MFDQLLQAYPEVHPEDFVTFGVLQEQPRRGSAREWGEVAGVLANMVGGDKPLSPKYPQSSTGLPGWTGPTL